MPEDIQDNTLRRHIEQAVDWIFGYDFFISYSHDDGLNFPRQLAERLKDAGFRVFLDQSDYVAGVDLRRETRRQVRNSRKVVIVGRPAAMASDWVMREAQAALDSSKIPVVIDINQAVETAKDSATLAALAKDNHWLRLNLSTEDPDGDPPDQVVSELVRGFDHTRQSQKRQLVFLSAAVVLAATTILATTLAFEARRQRDIAQANFETAKATADGLVVDVARGLRHVEGLQTESIRKILKRAEDTFGHLAGSVGDDRSLRLSRVAMQNEFVETYLAQGDTQAAQEAAQKSVALTKQLREQDSAVDNAKSQLALSFVKLGDAKQETGDYNQAEANYQNALDIRRAFSKQDTANDQAARDVAVVLARLAEIAEHRRDYRRMSDLLTASLEIREPLVARNPKWRRDLVVGNIMLGDAYMGLKQPENARGPFDLSIEVAKTLHEEDSTSTRAARHYAIALQRRGNLALELGDTTQANTDYTLSKSIFEDLSLMDPDHIEWQRDVGVSLGKLAKVAKTAGNDTLALELYSETAAYRRNLLAKSPENSLFKLDLAEALKDHGLHLKTPEAIPVLKEARALLSQLGALNELTDEQMNWISEIENELNSL